MQAPTIKQWKMAKKRRAWLSSLDNRRICQIIGIEIVCRCLPAMGEHNRVVALEGLQTVYDVALQPRKFGARVYVAYVKRRFQFERDSPSQMYRDHDSILAILSILESFVGGIDWADEIQVAVGLAVFQIDFEQQIELIKSILAIDQQFAFPAPPSDLLVYNDWLEERGMRRLGIAEVLN